MQHRSGWLADVRNCVALSVQFGRVTRLVAVSHHCFHLVVTDDDWCLSRGGETLPGGRICPLDVSCLGGSMKSWIMSVNWAFVPYDFTLAVVVWGIFRVACICCCCSVCRDTHWGFAAVSSPSP